MKYTHNQVVKSDCNGITEITDKWTSGDCKWEERKCLECGALMETPRKLYAVPHHWASEIEDSECTHTYYDYNAFGFGN